MTTLTAEHIADAARMLAAALYDNGAPQAAGSTREAYTARVVAYFARLDMDAAQAEIRRGVAAANALRTPIATVPAPVVPAQRNRRAEDTRVEEGFYRQGGEIYQVVTSKVGNRYAKIAIPTTGKTRFDYAPGMMNRLVAADAITAEDAWAQVGHATGWCGICGRELTNPESIARGIGPICAGNI